VYRGENARPEDWIQLGNHDTRTIWHAAEEWLSSGESRRQAEYLSTRLLAPGEDREAWVGRVAGDPRELVQARLADLFVGPARNVMVYFTDLLGERRSYNRPGTVSGENWSLRVPARFREVHRERIGSGRALDLGPALARALRSRGAAFVAAHLGVIEGLERGAGLGMGTAA
jgi:4-alpha-glucanotransferase